MVHAALLLLMLEGRHNDGPRFTISLKRSTQNLQLSTSWAGRLPPLSGEERKLDFGAVRSGDDPLQTLTISRYSLREPAGAEARERLRQEQPRRLAWTPREPTNLFATKPRPPGVPHGG